MAINDKNLFLDNGYLNMQEIIETPYTFIILVTGRGTGKTYGTLKYMVESIIYMVGAERFDWQQQGYKPAD